MEYCKEINHYIGYELFPKIIFDKENDCQNVSHYINTFVKLCVKSIRYTQRTISSVNGLIEDELTNQYIKNENFKEFVEGIINSYITMNRNDDNGNYISRYDKIILDFHEDIMLSDWTKINYNTNIEFVLSSDFNLNLYTVYEQIRSRFVDIILTRLNQKFEIHIWESIFISLHKLNKQSCLHQMKELNEKDLKNLMSDLFYEKRIDHIPDKLMIYSSIDGYRF